YLEGTGTMVLDHVSRVAYTAKSRRAHPLALDRFCAQFDYEPVFFSAQDSDGRAIYHTNILMSIATEFALVGFDSIRVKSQRRRIESRLADSGRFAVALSQSQLREFAGNAIELTSRHGHRILALSARAAKSLTHQQREVIEDSCRIIPVDVGPIEMAGGSVRCMIAGVHLQRRMSTSLPERYSRDLASLSQAV
ncbi:MAG: amidinotransferase, partial [Actinobacteria bacterium]|nr:amidinotransferase [Actinomycetota bacterium]